MNNTQGTMNNTNRHQGRNIIPPMVQNPVPLSAIIIMEREVSGEKRKATDEAHGEPRAKAPRTNMQPLNGLQQRNMAQPIPNFVSANIGQYPMDYDPRNPCFHNSCINNNNPYGHNGYNPNMYGVHYSNHSLDNGVGLKNNCNNSNINSRLIVHPSSPSQHSTNIQVNGSLNALNGQGKLEHQLIENCIALTIKYAKEKNWVQCRQEAEKGLKLPECSNAQKKVLYGKLNYACYELKEYAGAKRAIEALLELFECSDFEKISLYGQLSIVCNELKDYVGMKQVVEAALKLPECSNADKIALYKMLFVACNELKEYVGAKQALEAALKLSECSNAKKIRLYTSLSMACNELNEYVRTKQVVEAALKLPECSNVEKISLYGQLSIACNELKEYAEVKQAVESALELPDCSNSQKAILYMYLSLACYKLKDHAGAQEAAVLGLTFSKYQYGIKPIVLSILLKCDKMDNQEEELQSILSILDILKNRDDAVVKKSILPPLSEVITAEEVGIRLLEILKSKLDSESQKTIWKAIRDLAQMQL